MTDTTTAAYRVLGSNDDETECWLCGRQDLKKTVVLEELDGEGNGTGRTVRYGVDCAARAAGWTQADVRKAVTAADDNARQAAQRERNARDRAATEAYHAWLRATTGEHMILRAIQALGGHAAARAAYLAA